MGKKERNLAIGAAVGAGIGYAVGLLSAPRSGWRTRNKLAKNASKAKTDAEKQLKVLHTELKSNIADAEKKITRAKTKANKELKEAISSAKVAKGKVKLILSALHNGDAGDPDLKKALSDSKKAKENLARFLKK